MLERLQFTWKDKPYEVLTTAKTKIEEEWVESIVYIALYNNKDGEVFVKTEKDKEWEKFKEVVYNSREIRIKDIQDRTELRASGRTTRMADAYIQQLFKDGSIIVRDHYNEFRTHELLYFRVLDRLNIEHQRLSFSYDKTKLQITLNR